MKIPFRIHLITPAGQGATVTFGASDLVAAAQIYRAYAPYPGWSKLGFSFAGRYRSPREALSFSRAEPVARPPTATHIPEWLLWSWLAANSPPGIRARRIS